jgi:hypothetical protein
MALKGFVPSLSISQPLSFVLGAFEWVLIKLYSKQSLLLVNSSSSTKKKQTFISERAPLAVRVLFPRFAGTDVFASRLD